MKCRIESGTGADSIAWVAASTLVPPGRRLGESAGVWDEPGRMATSAIYPGSPPVETSGNYCLSRTLCLRATGRFNPLPGNQFQLRRTGGFPGFPGNFPGVYRVGGTAHQIECQSAGRRRAGAAFGSAAEAEIGANDRFIQVGSVLSGKRVKTPCSRINLKKSSWIKPAQAGSRWIKAF